ncbi:MAG: glycosyltransferase family 2 protein [Vulcanimicrobiaceae bacterium]
MTKNEARNLPRALASIPAGAATLVVDAQSDDATVALARSYGARTIVRPWAGFVATRAFALGEVETPWAFVLDADEALDDELARALAACAPDPATDGYSVARTTYLCGRPIRHGTWGGERLVRLVRRARASVVAAPAAGGNADVHEHLHVSGAVEALAGRLHHESYPTLAAYREKFARYTTLEARGVVASPGRLVRALALASLRVPFAIVVRGGWRDGWRGVFIALASAWYPVAVAWRARRA